MTKKWSKKWSKMAQKVVEKLLESDPTNGQKMAQKVIKRWPKSGQKVAKELPRSDDIQTATKQMSGFILYRVNPNICLGSVQNVDPVS